MYHNHFQIRFLHMRTTTTLLWAPKTISKSRDNSCYLACASVEQSSDPKGIRKGEKAVWSVRPIFFPRDVDPDAGIRWK